MTRCTQEFFKDLIEFHTVNDGMDISADCCLGVAVSLQKPHNINEDKHLGIYCPSMQSVMQLLTLAIETAYQSRVESMILPTSTGFATVKKGSGVVFYDPWHTIQGTVSNKPSPWTTEGFSSQTLSVGSYRSSDYFLPAMGFPFFSLL
jgi:hypothetical protein